MTTTSGLTTKFINETVGGVTSGREAELQKTLSELSESPSLGEMLKVQQQLQQWGMFAQVQSTLVKEVSDTLKNVIQKAA